MDTSILNWFLLKSLLRSTRHSCIIFQFIKIQWNQDITPLKGPASEGVIGGKALYAGNEFRA